MSNERLEVGVRELRNHLSRYLDRISSGDEVIVTDRGRPVARLGAVDASIDRLAELVAIGAVLPPVSAPRTAPPPRVVLGSPDSARPATDSTP